MKTIKLFSLLSMTIMLMFSCTNEIVDEDNSSSSSNNLKTGQVEMKGYPNSSGVISFQASAKKITINWGDGKTDEITPNGALTPISHQYPNSNFQTILVNAEDLTRIRGFTNGEAHELRFGDCPNLRLIDFSSNKLTVLDIKKANTLIGLTCWFNQLTELNLNGCKALRTLDCGANQLTAEKLNKLFDSLPSILVSLPSDDDGIIDINGQGTEGEYDCNKSIATNKGWRFGRVYFSEWWNYL